MEILILRFKKTKMKNLIVVFALLNLLVSCKKTSPITSDPLQISVRNGLIAYYPFTGNALDSSGNQNHGSVNMANLTLDRHGRTNSAYNFNGNAHIVVPHNTLLNLSGDFSISSWIRLSSNVLPNNVGMILSKHFGDVGNDGYSYGIWGVGQTNQINFQSFPSFSSSTYPGNTGAILTATWYNYTAVISPSSSQLRYYLNGSLVSTINISFAPIANTINLHIGAEPSSNNRLNRFFNGSIDDIRIYNRALTETEIRYLSSL